MKKIKKMVLGIGFYKREQWSQLLDTASDSYILEKSYDDWMNTLDASIEKIRAHDIEPVLVDIDINELLAFCKEQGLQNNAETRAKFISKQSRKKAAETPEL